MQRSRTVLLMFALVALATSAALAQADAQQAYEQAKTAFQAGKFAEARDMAKKAAETDAKNPEVFLLLGKAHYQLGELDDALTAWKQTLAFAPQEPYATKMIEILQAQRADVATRIGLVEALLRDRLHAEALRENAKLLADKALTDAQRAKLLLLAAEAHLGSPRPLGEGQGVRAPADTLAKVQQAQVLYPKQADALQAALLIGQAKLRLGPQAEPEGQAILNKLVADHADAPAAATAQFELIGYQLARGVEPARAEALAKWIADHPAATQVGEGLELLVGAYLALAQQSAKPTAESALGDWDAKALAVATQIYKRAVRTEEAAELTDRLIKHFTTRYAANGANAAAATAAETMLAAPLPRPMRLTALRALAQFKAAVATKWLETQARTGQLPATATPDALPDVLTAVVSVCDTIAKEYPAEAARGEQLRLAVALRSFAGRVLIADKPHALRGPDVWAIDLALPVVKANADPEAVQEALRLLGGMITAYGDVRPVETTPVVAKPEGKEPVERKPGREGDSPVFVGRKPGQSPEPVGLGISRQVIAALSPDHAWWPEAMTAYAKLLDSQARFVFAENVKAGRGEDNAKLSDVQKEFLDALAKLVARDAGQTTAALGHLAEHLKPWIEVREWAVAEEAYTTLTKALPEQTRREGELAVVNVWVQQVLRRDQRLAAAGLTVPRELDPVMKKALLRCYELQTGLEPSSPALPQIHNVWDSIVSHYKALQYDDVAEAAIKVKPEKAVAVADQYAALQLIGLQEEQARRELSRLLKQYGAVEKIALTPALKNVLAAWTKFIADQPTSPLAAQAVEHIFGIGKLFETRAAYDVAAGIYADFAKFAAGQKVLAQSSRGTPCTAERASLAWADALESQARKVLNKAIADHKPGDPPPAKLSDEFAAAIAAYKTHIEAYPESNQIGDLLRKIMGVATEYARIDAWDVAEGVYADLQKSKLKLRRPERLEFARGLCQLGRAMPDHAREVLGALTSAGLGARGEEDRSRPDDISGLALADGRPEGRTAAETPAKPAEPPARTATAPGPGPGVVGFGYSGGLGGGSGSLTINGGGVLNAPNAAAPPPPPAQPQAAPQPAADPAQAQRDSQLLAMIQQQQGRQASQVANLRDNVAQQPVIVQEEEQMDQQGQAVQLPTHSRQAVVHGVAPVLSEAELARQGKAFTAAYEIFQGIRTKDAQTPTAEQARGEILVMVSHWRELGQWLRSAALAAQFLTDNPTDGQLPQLRLEIARDRLAWAAKPIEKKLPRQELLAEVAKRFDAARSDLTKITADFPKEAARSREAQWDLASSFLTQARVTAAVSPTLARGQYVRATTEMRAVARQHPDHPRIGEIPQMLWTISQELEGRGFYEEAILVWNELVLHDPLSAPAQQAAMKIAETYHHKLKLPLRAAEAYQELNFARGGNDQSLQNTIFQIGSELKTEKRWVEALHVLESFVDSFPRHPQAGQALTMVGQIHQANEAWKDAIAAYRRVIAEFKEGQWVQDAKWSIAECTINLSHWAEAIAAYRDYATTYPSDAKVAEANRRIEVLKDLARYQGLVDEEGQRKSFDAQFQIATIVRGQLANPVKAIIEYRKVADRWPESHLADDALYEMGATYLSLGETEKAREALQTMAKKYPTSPLAGDALFMVGKSYEDEATKLATVTRAETIEKARDVAQKEAYFNVQSSRGRQSEINLGKVAGLKASGKGASAEVQEAANAYQFGQQQLANVELFAQKAGQDVEAMTAIQLADRQDKVNAALRKAIEAYTATSKLAGGNKADAALLQMATIYDQRLKDAKAAMQTWLEIVRQFSGTSVAEDASWKIAQYYEREAKYNEAIDAYQAFLRNYRRSPNAAAAQFAMAECYEHLGKWVNAMNTYTSYLSNFPEGPLAAKAKEQINWIKTYRL